MIKKITINDTASYKRKTSLETDSKINFIYGLNGSGKTVISNYLSDLKHEDFKSCCICGFNQERQKILVYNQKFVEDNFYESKVQKGVFTLKKENKEALQKIEKAERKKKDLQEKLDDSENGFKEKLKEKESEIQKNYDSAEERTWEIKTTYTGGDRVFDKAGFLDGLKGSKRKLLEHLIKRDPSDINKKIEGIKKELQQLGKNATRRERLDPIEAGPLSEIEENTIFQETIVGNKTLPIAKLISSLENADWVKKGIEYFPQDDSSHTCPLCQKETLTSDLQNEIKNYFDKDYEEQINSIKDLQSKYRLDLKKDYYEKDFFEDTDKEILKRLVQKLQPIVDENTNKISQKLKEPSQSVTLDSTKETIGEINSFITEKNKEINAFNQKLEKRDETIENLKNDFWLILRNEYDQTISSYNQSKKRLEREKKKIEEDLIKIEDSIKEQDAIISDTQKQVTTIEGTIEEINKHLLDFGIQDFNITKHGENNYQIKRKHEQREPPFKSFSEGEKTVISFLYFVELCRGKESQKDNKEKIIVIDDPISSLSHVYIFNVAQLIKKYFTKPEQKDFIQCFILTHSLYFFHELVNKKYVTSKKKDEKNLQKFFRLRKKESSEIEEMKPSEIRNDYQVYWDIVKNASQENMPLVANVMRNIIEYFFGFLDKAESINDIFQKGEFKDDENKFQSFRRYMERESHSDPMNLSDYKDFDLGTFKDAFKEVFRESGHQEHYNHYMK